MTFGTAVCENDCTNFNFIILAIFILTTPFFNIIAKKFISDIRAPA